MAGNKKDAKTLTAYSNPFHIHPMEFKNSRFAPKCAPKCWGFDRNPGCFIGKFFKISPRLRPNF